MGKIGYIVHHEKMVDSTQKLASTLAIEGAEEGVVVTADVQTDGRGQKNRTWYTGEGNNIAMSIILRPTLKPYECPQLTLLTAVAVVQAIEEVTGLQVSIKWPNDILYKGKKLVGILTEMKVSQHQLQYIILGIGINVNTPKEDFQDEINQIATSLMIESGKQVDKMKLMQCVFDKLEYLYRQYIQENFSIIKPLWEKYAISIGKEVTATTSTEVVKGTAIGITDEGVLLIKDKMNVIHEIYSADINIPQT